MKSSGKKVAQIKKCLKMGIPVATLGVTLFAVPGCNDSQVSALTSLLSLQKVSLFKTTVTLTATDFDLTRKNPELAESGKKKLDHVINSEDSNHHNIDIVFEESDPAQKRKMAIAVYYHFLPWIMRTHGMVISHSKNAAESILQKVCEEYGFKAYE